MKVDEMQADVKQRKDKKAGKEARRSEIQTERKGREKRQNLEELMEEVSEEDEVDDEEEEELGKPGADDLTEMLKLNGENVDYEPYVRRNHQEQEDELEDIFNELKTIVTSTTGPSVDTMITKNSQKGEGKCKHKNFDFDEDVGYYCGDCGTVGMEMPTSESSEQENCAHKNYKFSGEAGIICPDCGKIWREIESCYVANVMPRGKQTEKVQGKGDGIPPANLNLQGTGGNADFCGVDLQPHPFFEEKMHPHQKKGFKFLSENLLGGQQRSNEQMGCVLAHAPGTGKTCLVISFIQSFLAKFPQGKSLILAPKIMLQSWENEFEDWKVQEVPIYRIDCSARDTSPVDGGFENDEDEEDARLAPLVKAPLKEGRALKLREWQRGGGVLLMSYKLFAVLITNGLGDHVLPESLDYRMCKVLLESTNLVILDEGHLARNSTTQITRALLAMETKRRVLLSGTLFQNNFKELYVLLKLCRDDFMISHPEYGNRIREIAVNMHGSQYSNGGISCLEKKRKRELIQIEEKIFTEEIGQRLENYVKSGETRTDEIGSVVTNLQSLTASFVDWYPGEILKNLPGLIEYSIHLNLTEDQQRTIRGLPNANQVKHHMSRQYMLLAACIHPSLVHQGNEASLAFSQLSSSSVQKEACKGVKISFILRLMASCKLAGEKLLIFCSTLDPLTYIEKLFCKLWEWRQGQQMLRLDGSMQDFDRQKVIQRFNDKSSPSLVLLASTRACKEGITLVGASRVVILDNPDNPSVVRQAVSRAFRIGQKKKVYVYRLVATQRSEELIFKRSVSKERLSQVLSDPVSMSKFGNFLQEQRASDIEDELLKKLILTDREHGGEINVVYRYNAAG